MNTFFRTCIFICIGFIVFSLLISFVNSLGAFPVETEGGLVVEDETDALSVLTGLEDPNMNNIFLIATGVTAAAAIGLAFISHSIAPVGIYLFSLVFWTSYINAFNVVNLGSYIPAELVVVFTVGLIFIWIAAVIGMLTGSG